ncbi:MAG TPA: hypothetical protein DCM08_14270 [Microscillaceae bacterium]|nr:hypothetical protein [Microscillaceae bacterium]
MKSFLKFFVFSVLFSFSVASQVVAENKKPTKESENAFTGGIVRVKVVDSKGVIVMETQVSVNTFLGNKMDMLPTNSLFVVFHGNTAYYIVPSAE